MFENIKSLLISGLVGVILLLCASSNVYTEFDYDSTQAQITDITSVPKLKELNVTLSYTVNGASYTNSITTDTSFSNSVGDNVEIDYLKSNPNKILLHTNRTKTAIYSALGGLVCLVLCYFAFIQLERDVVMTERLFQ